MPIIGLLVAALVVSSLAIQKADHAEAHAATGTVKSAEQVIGGQVVSIYAKALNGGNRDLSIPTYYDLLFTEAGIVAGCAVDSAHNEVYSHVLASRLASTPGIDVGTIQVSATIPHLAAAGKSHLTLMEVSPSWNYTWAGKGGDAATSFDGLMKADGDHWDAGDSAAKSQKLRQNLKLATDRYHMQPELGDEAHHIVPGRHTNADAGAARARLAESGIGIDSAVNGIFLPGTDGDPKGRPSHRRVHSKHYFSEVRRRLEAAPTSLDIEEELYKIRQELLENRFPFHPEDDGC